MSAGDALMHVSEWGKGGRQPRSAGEGTIHLKVDVSAIQRRAVAPDRPQAASQGAY